MRNAAEVYYFIQRCIQSSFTEDQLNKCDVLIENIKYKRYAFTKDLINDLQVRRCEILINAYPVYE
jgi:hypothetical protein